MKVECMLKKKKKVRINTLNSIIVIILTLSPYSIPNRNVSRQKWKKKKRLKTKEPSDEEFYVCSVTSVTLVVPDFLRPYGL